jgi:hypothetical protein
MSTQFSPGRTLFQNGHKSTLSHKKSTIATTEPIRASAGGEGYQYNSPTVGGYINRGTGIVSASVSIEIGSVAERSMLGKLATDGKKHLSNLAILQSLGSQAGFHQTMMNFKAEKNR